MPVFTSRASWNNTRVYWLSQLERRYRFVSRWLSVVFCQQTFIKLTINVASTEYHVWILQFKSILFWKSILESARLVLKFSILFQSCFSQREPPSLIFMCSRANMQSWTMLTEYDESCKCLTSCRSPLYICKTSLPCPFKYRAQLSRQPGILGHWSAGCAPKPETWLWRRFDRSWLDSARVKTPPVTYIRSQ